MKWFIDIVLLEFSEVDAVKEAAERKIRQDSRASSLRLHRNSLVPANPEITSQIFEATNNAISSINRESDVRSWLEIQASSQITSRMDYPMAFQPEFDEESDSEFSEIPLSWVWPNQELSVESSKDEHLEHSDVEDDCASEISEISLNRVWSNPALKLKIVKEKSTGPNNDVDNDKNSKISLLIGTYNGIHINNFLPRNGVPEPASYTSNMFRGEGNSSTAKDDDEHLQTSIEFDGSKTKEVLIGEESAPQQSFAEKRGTAEEDTPHHGAPEVASRAQQQCTTAHVLHDTEFEPDRDETAEDTISEIRNSENDSGENIRREHELKNGSRRFLESETSTFQFFHTPTLEDISTDSEPELNKISIRASKPRRKVVVNTINTCIKRIGKSLSSNTKILGKISRKIGAKKLWQERAHVQEAENYRLLNANSNIGGSGIKSEKSWKVQNLFMPNPVLEQRVVDTRR
ncbi:hypothetical protein RUND412_006607 [Rhizina undulata]